MPGLSCLTQPPFSGKRAPTLETDRPWIAPTLCVGTHRLMLRVTGRTRSVRGGVTTRSVGTMRYKNPAAGPWNDGWKTCSWARTRGSGLVREEVGTADASPGSGNQPSRASLAPTGFVSVTQDDRSRTDRECVQQHTPNQKMRKPSQCLFDPAMSNRLLVIKTRALSKPSSSPLSTMARLLIRPVGGHLGPPSVQAGWPEFRGLCRTGRSACF